MNTKLKILGAMAIALMGCESEKYSTPDTAPRTTVAPIETAYSVELSDLKDGVVDFLRYDLSKIVWKSEDPGGDCLDDIDFITQKTAKFARLFERVDGISIPNGQEDTRKVLSREIGGSNFGAIGLQNYDLGPEGTWYAIDATTFDTYSVTYNLEIANLPAIQFTRQSPNGDPKLNMVESSLAILVDENDSGSATNYSTLNIDYSDEENRVIPFGDTNPLWEEDGDNPFGCQFMLDNVRTYLEDFGNIVTDFVAEAEMDPVQVVYLY